MEYIIALLVVSGALVAVITYMALEVHSRQNRIKFLVEERDTLLSIIEEKVAENQKLLNQKKSSEVRLGKIIEQVAPFLSEFPFDPRHSKFIGDPVDIVQFNPDEIVFVEIKTGKSQLSKKQRAIKKMVEEGKVRFEVVRFGDKPQKELAEHAHASN